MHSRRELADGFRRLGVTAGDTVMLHASVRAVGAVAGGPDQIHLALKDALTLDGTLIMYAGCPAYTDEVGRGHLTQEQERDARAFLLDSRGLLAFALGVMKALATGARIAMTLSDA